MIATLPTQQQVDRIERKLVPDVVRIRFTEAQDWSGDPAIYFRVTLSDEASRRDRLADVARFGKGEAFRRTSARRVGSYFLFQDSQPERANHAAGP
jgi:hypothetical protein